MLPQISAKTCSGGQLPTFGFHGPIAAMIKLLMLLLFPALAPVSQAQPRPFFSRNFAVVATNAPTIWVDPNGDDLNPGTQQAPKHSVLGGLAAASSGGTVLLQPGVYDEGTNLLDIPHDVNLIGYGPRLICSRDLSDGPQIVP